MKHYEKPIIFMNEDLAEGVYLTSGDTEGKTMQVEASDCDWFKFNQPVKVIKKVFNCAGIEMAEGDYKVIVSTQDKNIQRATILVEAKEDGHGAIKIVDQGNRHH